MIMDRLMKYRTRKTKYDETKYDEPHSVTLNSRHLCELQEVLDKHLYTTSNNYIIDKTRRNLDNYKVFGMEIKHA